MTTVKMILAPLMAGTFLLASINPSHVKTGTGNVEEGRTVAPLSKAAESGLKFLADAQFENGAWGAGSSARQDIRDPHAVQVDPATTAFCALAFVRSGSTLESGPYHQNVKNALMYLIKTVEESDDHTPNITTLTGTQPQVKLGQNIDVALTAQFFTRILDFTKSDPQLDNRTRVALGKCIAKIQGNQTANGSFAGGSWAPVLQSAMANNALEYAKAQNIPIDEKVLQKSRDYQAGMVSGTVSAPAGGTGISTDDVEYDRGYTTAKYAPARMDAAGVELYSASSSYRANVQQSLETVEVVSRAKKAGKIKATAEVNRETLIEAGVDKDEAEKMANSYNAYKAAEKRLQDETVLNGFGNNGGEEYLSHMMTGESMVIGDPNAWQDWKSKMFPRIEKVQNGNGSWSGYHCITSPVFCTAAAIMMLTVENDKDFLSAGNKTEIKKN